MSADVPLFEGHDTPLPDSTHVLVAEADTDHPGKLRFAIECSGVRPSCEGWVTCDEEHSDEECERLADADYGTSVILHGERHIDTEEGPALSTGKCILLHDSDFWSFSAEELVAIPGRYSVNQEWMENNTIELYLIEATAP